jgi:hypothetical protein
VLSFSIDASQGVGVRKAYRGASHQSTATMDFAHSPAVLARRARLDAFIERYGYVLRHNAAWQSSVKDGVFPEFMEDLKALAKEEGMWNLCLPHLREGCEPRAKHPDHAARVAGRALSAGRMCA